ncbi:MAG TPA: hypothetical protein VHY76_06110 [Acetobacteraceae bacterium]|nr:hypothetical protein [Acetobacteraceae bacterium]
MSFNSRAHSRLGTFALATFALGTFAPGGGKLGCFLKSLPHDQAASGGRHRAGGIGKKIGGALQRRQV